MVRELSGLMGRSSAEALQTLLQGAFHHRGTGLLSTIIGGVTLVVTATGVFAELQNSLNEIWKAGPAAFTTSEIIRVRLLSLGLIGTLGFLLIVSLLMSTALQALGNKMAEYAPGLRAIIFYANGVGTFVLLSIMFGAIYKVLPDRRIDWRDVAVGAVMTSLLFAIGKFLISLYIGGSAIATAYGSAGSIIVMLLWVYYSTQIFLFGAEFTKVWALRREAARARRAGNQSSTISR